MVYLDKRSSVISFLSRLCWSRMAQGVSQGTFGDTVAVLVGPRGRGHRCLTESGTDHAGRQTDVLFRKFYHRSLDVIQGSSSSMQQLNQKHFLIMKWEVPFICFLSYYRQLKVSKCFSEPV